MGYRSFLTYLPIWQCYILIQFKFVGYDRGPPQLVSCGPLVSCEGFAIGLWKQLASVYMHAHPHLHKQWVSTCVHERQASMHAGHANGAACACTLAGRLHKASPLPLTIPSPCQSTKSKTLGNSGL